MNVAENPYFHKTIIFVYIILSMIFEKFQPDIAYNRTVCASESGLKCGNREETAQGIGGV
jgi:hypothetical protein